MTNRPPGGILLLGAVLMVAAATACSSTPQQPAPSGSEGASSSAPVTAVVNQNGVDVRIATDRGSVTVTGGPRVAAEGTELALRTIDPVDTGDGAALALATTGVAVRLGDGRQPDAPLTLKFQVAADDTTFDRLGDDTEPVVVAVSESTPDSAELLPATWDTATRTLTATTTHLSDFRPGLVDFSGLRETVKKNVDGFLGRSVDPPACLGASAVIGGTTYDAIVPAGKVVYPCVSSDGGKVVVTLYSNSPLGWIARSTPPPTDRSEMSDSKLTAAANSALYASLLDSDLGDGALLHPQGVTKLVYEPGDAPRRIDLRAQAAMTLVDVGMHGTSMTWGGNTAADLTNPFDLETTTDCIADPVTVDQILSATDQDAGELSRRAMDCTNGVNGWAVKSEALSISEKARRTLGTTITGIASLPKSAELFSATITGLGGELSGKNHATVILRARGVDAAAIAGIPDEVFTIDRIELDNRPTEPVSVGRKIGPYLYQLGTIGQGTRETPRVDVAYSWGAYTAPTDDEQDGVRYTGDHCQITVVLDGPEAAQHEDLKSARCSDGYASSFAGLTKFTVATPGRYTLRLHDAVTGLSAESTFTVER